MGKFINITILTLFLITASSTMCTRYIDKQCNLLTWNVRGIMSSAGTLSDILDKQSIDIAIITEHKLKDTHKDFLNSIHSNYRSLSKFDDSVDPQTRCGKGGVAILYRNELAFQIRQIDGIQSNRITGLELSRKNCLPVLIFAVYMPSINYCNDDYMEVCEVSWEFGVGSWLFKMFNILPDANIQLAVGWVFDQYPAIC